MITSFNQRTRSSLFSFFSRYHYLRCLWLLSDSLTTTWDDRMWIRLRLTKDNERYDILDHKDAGLRVKSLSLSRFAVFWFSKRCSEFFSKTKFLFWDNYIGYFIATFFIRGVNYSNCCHCYHLYQAFISYLPLIFLFSSQLQETMKAIFLLCFLVGFVLIAAGGCEYWT